MVWAVHARGQLARQLAQRPLHQINPVRRRGARSLTRWVDVTTRQPFVAYLPAAAAMHMPREIVLPSLVTNVPRSVADVTTGLPTLVGGCDLDDDGG